MAGTVITDLIFFTGATGGSTSNCDAETDWVSVPTLNTEVFVQGTGALSAKVSKTTFTSVFSLSAAIDLTNKIIYVWAMSSTVMDTIANGGFRIRVEDGLGNWGEWYLAGRDTWSGGWTPWAVHTNTTFSNNSATLPTINAITKVGIVFKCTGSATAPGCFWDAMRYGTFIGVKAGTEASPATSQDIIDAENLIANKYGVLRVYAGVVLVQGKLKFGSTTLGENTYFKDTTSRTIIFPKAKVPSTFFEIILQGNATGTTEVYLGDKVGGAGVAGPIFRCEDPAIPYKVTATDTNVTKFGFWGCAFYNAGIISGQAYNVDKEFLTCTFFKCSQMEPNTGIVKDCSFLSTTGRAVLMNSASHNITYNKFINCQTAVHIPLSVAVPFNNLKFYGNDPYDIEHSVAGTLTVNCTDSNPDPAKVNETGGGNTSIVNTVILTVRHVKTGTEPTEYVRCYIEKKSDQTEIMNQDADQADDLYSGYYKAVKSDYNYPGSDVTVIVRAREKGYLPFETEATITSSGLDVTAVWIVDPNYQA